MLAADATTSTVQHSDLQTDRTAPAPAGGVSSADRLMLHIVVGLVLGAAFAVAHENWLMIIVGGALGVLFGSTGTVLERHRV
ncbi:hypothetical protein [Micrococcus terreus]|uniref:Uncharacterized protein n=1 Tax=Micrococcus terreus TaxID=574650 RepID=A0A1I7MK38_9MICC|nr:hypothetical protein [Micrococcus terreus]SFV22302.1 hypothetical protein SAMN04487966_10412 [Micrococcus terreus]